MNSTAAITSPCSCLLNTLPVRPLSPLTSTPLPSASVNTFGLSGDGAAALTSFQSPSGARQPASDLPLLTVMLVLAGGGGGASCARAWPSASRPPKSSRPLLAQRDGSLVMSKKLMRLRGGIVSGQPTGRKAIHPAKRCGGPFGITVAFVFLKIWLAKAVSKNSLCSCPVL